MPSSIYPIGSQTGNVAFSANAIYTTDGTGVLYLSSSIIPLLTTFDLGTITSPYKDLYVAGGSINIASYVPGVTGVELTSLSGNLTVNNAGFQVISPTTGKTTFIVSSAGKVEVLVPYVSAGTYGAVAIIGSSTGVTQPVTNNGTMLHITANDFNNSTFLMDAFGTGVFPQHVSRLARGTSIAPAPISAGDVIVKIVANGYNSLSGFVLPNGSKFGATTIEAVATENWNNSIGSQWNFYNAASGDLAASKQLQLSINQFGIQLPTLSSGITFSDGSRQSSAFTASSGTWTPILTAAVNTGGISYTNANIGNYFRNGKNVFCTFNIVLSSLNSTSGNIYLTGLPLPVANGNGTWGTLQVYRYLNMKANANLITGGNESNVQNFTLYYIDNSGGGITPNMTVANLNANSQLYGSLTYATG